VRVGSRFACDETVFELLEGGVNVIGIERDDRCDPSLGVDLGYL
jgi:hypothetical protein